MIVRGPASVADAYSATGQAWQDGPGRIYDRLADVLVARIPQWDGRLALDLGAGTGAASRAIRAAGGTPIAVDVALGMLAAGRDRRPPAAVGDALALPFASGSFDAVVAAFSLNHVTDPAAALREAARVGRRGASLIVSAYADDDGHPVKAAVERAASELGWGAAQWYGEMRRDTLPRLATVERATTAAAEAGLAAAVVEADRVEFPELTARELVAWRLGMAQMAWFVAELSAAERRALVERSLDVLGLDMPPLVRSIIVLTSTIG